jgi:ubiquitin-like protein Pup
MYHNARGGAMKCNAMFFPYLDALGNCGVGSNETALPRGCMMDKQDRKQESRKPSTPQESEEIQADPKVAETGQRLTEEMDDLVDEIDKVLEENAAEFVKNYVQKGGE